MCRGLRCSRPAQSSASAGWHPRRCSRTRLSLTWVPSYSTWLSLVSLLRGDSCRLGIATLVAAAMARFTDSSIGMQPFACMAILHLLAHITLRWLRRDDGSLSHHRAILVTGAGSGIGRALCEVLLLRGDSIVAVDADVDALARLHRWHCQQGATYARDEHFIPPERRRGSKFLSSPIKCGYTIDYGVDPDDPPNHKSNLLSIPCDVSDAASVADAVKTLKIQWPSRASQWGLQHADDEGRGEIRIPRDRSSCWGLWLRATRRGANGRRSAADAGCQCYGYRPHNPSILPATL